MGHFGLAEEQYCDSAGSYRAHANDRRNALGVFTLLSVSTDLDLTEPLGRTLACRVW
jgi:hypothetical protein